MFWFYALGLPVALIGCCVLGAFVAWWRVLLVMTSAVVALVVWLWYNDLTLHRFHGEVWRAEAAKPCQDRHRRDEMVDDLLVHHELEISSPAEARRLLGPPDTKGSSGSEGPVFWRWEFATGFEACASLEIGFDDAGYYGASVSGSGNAD